MRSTRTVPAARAAVTPGPTRTRRFFATTIAAVAVFAVGACADRADDTPKSADSAGSAFPVTVGTLTLDRRPEKIVSLSPTATEMLFAIGAGKQVAAVDDQSNYPAEAPGRDLSAFNPNAEAIAAKSPDLVVISNDMNKITDQLTKLHIPVFLAPAATNLDGTYQQLGQLGQLTGHPKEATELSSRMRTEIDQLVRTLPKRSKPLTYFHEVDSELYTVTSKTFIGSVYALAGLENIADPSDADGSKGGYPQLSREVIVKANPDFVFLADAKCCKQTVDSVKTRAGWADVTAVKANQVVTLDDDIASRWGPRVVDLVRVIVAAVARAQA